MVSKLMRGTDKQRHLIQTLMTLVHAGLYSRVLILIRDTSHYNWLTDIIHEQTPDDQRLNWVHLKDRGTLRHNRGAVIRVCTEGYVNSERINGQQWDMVVPFDPSMVIPRMAELGLRLGENPMILRATR